VDSLGLQEAQSHEKDSASDTTNGKYFRVSHHSIPFHFDSSSLEYQNSGRKKLAAHPFPKSQYTQQHEVEPPRTRAVRPLIVTTKHPPPPPKGSLSWFGKLVDSHIRPSASQCMQLIPAQIEEDHHFHRSVLEKKNWEVMMMVILWPYPE
jgi:hypothetical protein